MTKFTVQKRVWVTYTVEADSVEEAEQDAKDTSFLDHDDWAVDGEELDIAKPKEAQHHTPAS